jgi:hypothetical protein
MTTCGEWWIVEGQNTLRGIPGSAFDPPINPPIIDPCTGELLNPIHGAVLSDEMIICFLRSNPAARASICRLLPLCSLDEQARLQAILDGPGRWLKSDPKIQEEAFQRAMNGTPQVRIGPGPLGPNDPRRNT